MEQAGVSQVEMSIRQCLYWPDGTFKKRSKSLAIQKSLERMRQLVHAVVDQYSEDHNLSGILHMNSKMLCSTEYFVRNLCSTTISISLQRLNKLMILTGMDKLFFAEVKSPLQAGPEQLVISCFRMIDPIDDGHCHGCPNDMKHPDKADAYTGGHVPADKLFGCRGLKWSDCDQDEKAKETRIRRMYADQKPYRRSPYATGRRHWSGSLRKAPE